MGNKRVKLPERFYGYKHWSLEEVPRCFYVGKGIRSRPETHMSRNHKWRAIVKRYGIRVEICIGPIIDDEVCKWEIATIAEMGTFSTNHSHDDPTDIGCNFTRGGETVTGLRWSIEARNRHSNRMSGVLAGQRIGEKHPMYGKKHTLESRAKMGRSGSKNHNFRRIIPIEERKRQSEVRKGRPQTSAEKAANERRGKKVTETRMRRKFHKLSHSWFMK